jgi:hypothetical protein
VSKLSLLIDFVEELLYNLNTYIPKRGKIMKNLNKPTIIFSILYILIGAQDLIMGAVPSSRFFFYDNILVRLGGAVLLISSIGILMQKEMARKGILIALILLIIDLIVGIPVDYSSSEIVAGYISSLILYIPGMLYLAFPESPIWIKLFGRFKRNKKNSSSVDLAEQRIRDEIKRENKIKNGSAWFFIIAVLSIVNSIIFYTDGSIYFIFGLGITQLADGFFYSMSDYFGIIAIVSGLMVNAVLAGLLVYIGFMARKLKNWAFITGMILYGLDTIVFVIFNDQIGILAHVFAFTIIFMSYRALKDSSTPIILEADLEE